MSKQMFTPDEQLTILSVFTEAKTLWLDIPSDARENQWAVRLVNGAYQPLHLELEEIGPELYLIADGDTDVYLNPFLAALSAVREQEDWNADAFAAIRRVLLGVGLPTKYDW